MSRIFPEHRWSSEVETYFVRDKCALFASVLLEGLAGDYFSHIKMNQLDYGPGGDDLLIEAMAALALHAASRPWTESFAWTIHFEEPLRNVFVCADNALGRITGTVFLEDVKKLGSNLFHSQVVSPHYEPRSSFIEFSDSQILDAVEEYFERSEQRLARLFRTDALQYVMVQAQPDCDLEWLTGLQSEDAQEIKRRLELSRLETRGFSFYCGCDDGRMMDFLLPLMREKPEELFAGESALRMRCPRCGRRHLITREALEARLAEKNRSI